VFVYSPKALLRAVWVLAGGVK